jgi:peptidoglycan/LPS O-acetylase OafA/YrhL
LKYRAEIDGLRALAVVPVILFHAGFELFSGGFVGVDVFFVISGYLITTILIDDIENNRFSIVNFYERRARRILPALSFVMLVCIPFAWMWMLPSQMKDFSQSLVAVSLFASNILFWRESGYFDASAEEKPLLHTWSLAVEEQYYVLFPIFLFFAWRFGKNRVFWIIVVVAAASLLLSEWGFRNKPTANFYLAPTRAWELLAGSIAAFIVQNRGVKANNALSLLGLAAILFSIFAYDESTPFPSVYALVPVIGVVLLVLFAEKDTLVAKFLSMKLIVGMGLIRYSAYLWHQPLFAFARIKLVDEPTMPLMSFLAIASIALAILSWKFVEEPFRSRKGLISKRSIVFSCSAISLIGFLIIGLLGHQGILNPRVSGAYAEIQNKFSDLEYGGDGYNWVEEVSKPKYLLVGDSHAKQYFRSFNKIINNVSMYAVSACISLPDLINEYKFQNIQRTDCINLHKIYLDYLRRNPSIKTLFIAHRWEKQFFELSSGKVVGRANQSIEAKKVFLDNLESLFSLMPKDVKVVIIGNVPAAYVAGQGMQQGLINCLAVNEAVNAESECPLTYEKSLRESLWINKLLFKLAKKLDNVNYFDPGTVLCNSDECYVVNNGRLIYSDHAHLTSYGADLVVGHLKDYLLSVDGI